MAALRNGLKCIAHPAFSGTPLFNHFTLPILGISQSSTFFSLNPNLIFEIGSIFVNVLHERPLYHAILDGVRPW